MNWGVLLGGAFLAVLGALAVLSPTSPLLDNFASVRLWREDPERAEATHRRTARRYGAGALVLGLVLVAWALLARRRGDAPVPRRDGRGRPARERSYRPSTNASIRSSASRSSFIPVA